MGNTKTKKKKILILTFEDYYTKKMYSNISQRELTDELENGFITDNIDYNNIEFSVWYLSSKNRHLWKHHFIATQGIVIVFSFRDEKTDKGVIYEALRIFYEELLSNVPFLVLLDKNNRYLQSDFIIEVNKMKKNDVDNGRKNTYDNILVDAIEFNKVKLDLQSGFNWICEQIANEMY